MKLLLNFKDENVIKNNQDLLNKIIFKYKLNLLDIFYNLKDNEEIKFNYKNYTVIFKDNNQINNLFEEYKNNSDKKMLTILKIKNF